MGASILLMEDGRAEVLGMRLEPRLVKNLLATYASVEQLGTPTAVHIGPDGTAVVLQGFDHVTATLIELSGGVPDRVVSELPTSCSVKVGAAPVDALMTAWSRERSVGIAARGQDAIAVAADVAEGADKGHSDQRGYVPVTLLLERPQKLFLLFRGGELVARTRNAQEARPVLDRIVAGFHPLVPAAGKVVVQCGALAHEEGRALLFPVIGCRIWSSAVPHWHGWAGRYVRTPSCAWHTKLAAALCWIYHPRHGCRRYRSRECWHPVWRVYNLALTREAGCWLKS
ncbi:hypothetical protein [Streptomyces sp. NPDC049555]|uniref:hypothetical protein n=1 Tax=unclassified Streptomyces TaxID=2593676 RepID=UPI0034127919